MTKTISSIEELKELGTNKLLETYLSRRFRKEKIAYEPFPFRDKFPSTPLAVAQLIALKRKKEGKNVKHIIRDYGKLPWGVSFLASPDYVEGVGVFSEFGDELRDIKEFSYEDRQLLKHIQLDYCDDPEIETIGYKGNNVPYLRSKLYPLVCSTDPQSEKNFAYFTNMFIRGWTAFHSILDERQQGIRKKLETLEEEVKNIRI